MNDLTIVLPLKDKSNFTYRWMKYAEKKFQDYKIIIADGGKDKEVETILSNKSNYNKIDYQYYRYPYDSNPIQFFSKLSDAINKTETKYCLLADNDDFFFKEGIDKSITFLNSNIDYSCCRGVIGQFTVDPENNKLRKFFFGDANDSSLILEDPLLRLMKAVTPDHGYLPSYFDVHRTENLKKNYKFLHEMHFKDLTMMEVLPGFLDAIDGKIHRTNDLFLMRQIRPKASYHYEYIYKHGVVLERIVNGNYISEYNKMKSIIYKKMLKKKSLVEDEIIKNKIELGLLMFLRNSISNANKGKILNKNNILKDAIKKILPNKIKNKMSKYIDNQSRKKLYSQYLELIDINNFFSMK